MDLMVLQLLEALTNNKTEQPKLSTFSKYEVTWVKLEVLVLVLKD